MNLGYNTTPVAGCKASEKSEKNNSQFNGLLPKSLFALFKAFFDKSKACRSIAEIPLSGLQVLSKLAFRAQTVESIDLPLRQDLFAKKRFNDYSKGFEQQPVKPLHRYPMIPSR